MVTTGQKRPILNSADSCTLSVIVPTFNRLPYLTTTLENIYSELDGFSFEIIAVDGGSDDGTVDYLLNIKNTKSNIVLLRQTKLLGFVNAFKAGLNLATGKYVVARHDHSFTKRDPLLKACQLMDAVPKISLVFEKVYKYPSLVHKAQILGGYFPLTE